MIHNHETVDDMSLVEHGTFLMLGESLYTANQIELANDMLAMFDGFNPEESEDA